MRSMRIALAVGVCLLLCVSTWGTPDPAGQPPLARLCDLSPAELDVCLHKMAEVENDPAKRLVRWALANVGQPYSASDPRLEMDEVEAKAPVWRLEACDGRDFVEQLCALAVSDSHKSATEALRTIRYRDGVIKLEHRNHNLAADWTPNNARLLEDITPKLANKMAWIPLHRVVRRAEFLHTRYGLDVDVSDEKHIGCFIPRVYLYKVLDELRDGDIAVFISGDDREQSGFGMGVIHIDSNDEIMMVYCTEPVAVEDNFRRYTFLHKEILGYKFLRFSAAPAVNGSDSGGD